MHGRAQGAGLPLPFLQPRILDADGRTRLDFRGTAWGASLRVVSDRPQLLLQLFSDEDEKRVAEKLALNVDLITRRVSGPRIKGATSLGMLQALLRHVRGVKWLGEDLPALLAKGRELPAATAGGV